MEDPAERSNLQPERPAEAGMEAAGNAEEAKSPASAPTQADARAEEERPAAEVPVIPPAEHAEPMGSEVSRDGTPVGETEGQESSPATETGAAEGAEGTAKAPAARAAQEAPRPRFADLSEGMVLDGTVTRIERYGAFVNLGLADRREGLIHISELSPYRVRRVEDVVKVGDSVRARVVSLDQERRRIALSLNEIPDESVPQQPSTPPEPTLTAMALAFERARSRRRDEEGREEGNRTNAGAEGSRKKREQESLMRKLRTTES